LLFYFLRRLRKNLEIVGQLAGVAASAIAILRYEEINDWSVRLFGAGADNATVGLMLVLAVLGFIQLWWPFRIPRPIDAAPQAASPAAGGARTQVGPAATAKPAVAATTAAAGTAPAAGPTAALRGTAPAPPLEALDKAAASAASNPGASAMRPASAAQHGSGR
jgi:hypothetical protein